MLLEEPDVAADGRRGIVVRGTGGLVGSWLSAGVLVQGGSEDHRRRLSDGYTGVELLRWLIKGGLDMLFQLF